MGKGAALQGSARGRQLLGHPDDQAGRFSLHLNSGEFNSEFQNCSISLRKGREDGAGEGELTGVSWPYLVTENCPDIIGDESNNCSLSQCEVGIVIGMVTTGVGKTRDSSIHFFCLS